MHVACTILERSLILEEESLQRVQAIHQAQYPPRSSPRCAQRQIKLALFNRQRQRIVRILKEWGEIMWKFSARPNEISWSTAFTVLSLLILVMDKTLISAYYLYQGRITLGESGTKVEQAAFQDLVTLTQRELFEQCKEIFHSKFKTRKAGKETCNPIRDGITAFRGADHEQRTGRLVEGLQQLVKVFGT